MTSNMSASNRTMTSDRLSRPLLTVKQQIPPAPVQYPEPGCSGGYRPPTPRSQLWWHPPVGARPACSAAGRPIRASRSGSPGCRWTRPTTNPPVLELSRHRAERHRRPDRTRHVRRARCASRRSDGPRYTDAAQRTGRVVHAEGIGARRLSRAHRPPDPRECGVLRLLPPGVAAAGRRGPVGSAVTARPAARQGRADRTARRRSPDVAR